MKNKTETKEKEMYESYDWPGAYTLKDEVEVFKKWIQELFTGVIKEIQNKAH